jgi:dTDP-4-amino-4,6-dideoxygalactose transaminase
MTDQTIPMLDLVRLHKSIRAELKNTFLETLDSGQFIGGLSVERFEGELAEYVGAKHAIGVSSGTDALIASLMALNVGLGDEVVTTSYTFFATAGSIARLGAKPVFVDIDNDTFNLDPGAIEEVITDRTVGILPVHLFGLCAPMEPILKIAEKHGLWVLEDAAQAIGAEYRGRGAGTMGTMGTFSFFPAKNLGAMGDGGAVVTDDSSLASRVKQLRQHGAKQKHFHETIGGNFRLDSLQAAILSVKLPHLKTWEEARRKVARGYSELLGNTDELQLPEEGRDCRHVYNQYVFRSKKRDEIQRALTDAGIGSAIYYPEPLHTQKCFESITRGEVSLKRSEQAASESLAIPIDPLLEDKAIEKIARVINEV